MHRSHMMMYSTVRTGIAGCNGQLRLSSPLLMTSEGRSPPPVLSEVFDEWLRIELSHAKFSYSDSSSGRHWGRAVIRSIDLDDSIMLYSSLTMQQVGEPTGAATANAAVLSSDQHQLIADRINTQVDCLGYAEYLWTASIHRFLGDTALHLAIRQRKMRCVHMLLLLEADVHIKNEADETAHLMVAALLHTTVRELRFEAVRFILRNTPTKDIGRFPNMHHLRFQRIEKEAWDLMKAGRIMYSAPPSTLSKADPALKLHVASARTKYLSINTSAAEAEQHRGEQDQALASATDSQSSWVQMSDADGNQYFYNEVTGESSWDKPAHIQKHESSEPLQDHESSKVEVGAAAASDQPSAAAAGTPVSVGGDAVKGRRSRAKAKADKLLILAESMADNGTSSITGHPPEEVPIAAVSQPIVLSKVAALRDQYSDRPSVSKVTALRVEIESLQQEAAVRSAELKAQRTGNDAALMTAALHEEIDRINRGIEEKGREYRQALKVLNNDDRVGATSTPAGKMGPDVWGRDQLVDMVRLLERQKERRTKALHRSNAPVARGLTLLDSVRASSSTQSMIRLEEELLPTRGVRDLYVSEQTVQRLETLKQLKFVDTSKLLPLSHLQQSKLHQNSEKQMNSNGVQSNVDYAQARDITRLSTYSNLKHYNIGDDGIRALSAVLNGDCTVQHLCLAGARITSSGIVSFAEVAPNIRRLSYLDLSSNAICDVGARALSEALPKCDLLATCILSGNRIGMEGLVLLVQWAMKSQSVGFCGLQNNELEPDDLQLVEKLMDEHDYSCRVGGTARVYLKSAGSACIRGTDDDSSMMFENTSSVKKIVL